MTLEINKLPLANLPTPIQFLPIISKELGKNIYVWRDDLTGFWESGNKVRKLEFHLAQALKLKANHIITCGAIQSNHTRATTVTCKKMGLAVTILVFLPEHQPDQNKLENGNILINKIFGAKIKYIEYQKAKEHHFDHNYFLQEEAKLIEQNGESPFCIPLGGSNALGSLGYFHATAELQENWHQNLPQEKFPSEIFCALGTGGTYAGIYWGLKFNQHKSTNLWGINIINTHQKVTSSLKKIYQEIKEKYQWDLSLNPEYIIEGYLGEGYAKTTEAELSFLTQLAQKEGLLLDPCYSGKAFRGMYQEIQKNPQRFGENILFVHTGGGFSVFAYANEFKNILI